MERLSCFGIPSVINLREPTCKGCADKRDCARDAYRLLKSLSKVTDLKGELEVLESDAEHLLSDPQTTGDTQPTVERTIKAPAVSAKQTKVKLDISEDQLGMLMAMPVKIAQKMKSLISKGIDKRAPALFARGENPFEMNGHRYLHIAGQMLLKGGATRAELMQEMRSTLDWTEGTAASHATAVFALMQALKVAEVKDGRLVLLPKESGQD